MAQHHATHLSCYTKEKSLHLVAVWMKLNKISGKSLQKRRLTSVSVRPEMTEHTVCMKLHHVARFGVCGNSKGNEQQRRAASVNCTCSKVAAQLLGANAQTALTLFSPSSEVASVLPLTAPGQSKNRSHARELVEA